MSVNLISTNLGSGKMFKPFAVNIQPGTRPELAKKGGKTPVKE